jgi:hypothetical protein
MTHWAESDVIMDAATGLASDDAGSDPYFRAEDVGAAKAAGPRADDPQRRRRQFRLRTGMSAIALVALAMGILLDPNLAPLALMLLGAFGTGLGVLAAGMALGILGFGFCAAGERAVSWLRRAATWPDD